jgi:hypothetical protein
VAAAVEQLNIEIAFQFMNGVAQRRRRFIELCRRGGKAPSFSSASRMTRTSSSGFIAAPLRLRFPLADYSIGITSGSGYWYSNPSSLQIRLPSTILPLPPSGLSQTPGRQAKLAGHLRIKDAARRMFGRTYIIDVPALRSLQQQLDCGHDILQMHQIDAVLAVRRRLPGKETPG